jgi:hypothetical protein
MKKYPGEKHDRKQCQCNFRAPGQQQEDCLGFKVQAALQENERRHHPKQPDQAIKVF